MPPLLAVPTPTPATVPDRDALRAAFDAVRAETLARAAPLSAEDQCVQSMPDASPTKWHLAHTTWFFETLVLLPHWPGHVAVDPAYGVLFNSYYEALGPRHPRPQRGLLTRPSLAEVHAYREAVDRAVRALIAQADAATWARVAPVLTLGLHHEQQHQELVVTDALHLLAANPLLPTYGLALPQPTAPAGPARWLSHPGGATAVGHVGGGFAFDNEGPRHRVWLAPFQIADRLVTQGEYAAFVADGGYRRPSLWLSAGWEQVLANGWTAPPHWLAADDARLYRHAHVPPGVDGWRVYGLQGVAPLDPQDPVGPLSFFEAAAYAEWAGARLPTEFEWETACRMAGFAQATGHLWQWTRSSYDPYPGFRPLEGPAAEYNGKFMVGQLVLRGGSLATPAGHTRPSYRNFFPPAARWQFTGLRLAKDLG